MDIVCQRNTLLTCVFVVSETSVRFSQLATHFFDSEEDHCDLYAVFVWSVYHFSTRAYPKYEV